MPTRLAASRLLRGTFTAPKDHIAVITGGASGIGKAICHSFLDAGSRVVAIDRAAGALTELAKSVEEKSPEAIKRVVCRQADITLEAHVESLFEDVTNLLGSPPDVVCNCAGIAKDGWLAKMAAQDWDDVMDANLKGTFLMTKAFVRHRLAAGGERPGGVIINISSIVGKAGNMGQTSYAASKAGVVGFTKSAAKELAPHGIRINCVLPGFILTPMVASVPDKVKSKILKQITTGEFGDPQEVADTVLFLSSSSASYMTGNSIEVAGGLWA